MNDVMIAYPNTRPMCSANCDGAAAAVVVTGAKLKTLSLEQQRRAVKVSASVLTTDPWEEACQILPDVNTLTRNAAEAGLRAGRRRPRGPRPRRAARLLRHRRARALRQPHAVRPRAARSTSSSRALPWRDGTTPVNVSGGLESKGHPIAATGIANIWEVCHHLRGEAGDRQIEGAKVGLAHVIGLARACGVHILERTAAVRCYPAKPTSSMQFVGLARAVGDVMGPARAHTLTRLDVVFDCDGARYAGTLAAAGIADDVGALSGDDRARLVEAASHHLGPLVSDGKLHSASASNIVVAQA